MATPPQPGLQNGTRGVSRRQPPLSATAVQMTGDGRAPSYTLPETEV
jgi:hypothetical protein